MKEVGGQYPSFLAYGTYAGKVFECLPLWVGTGTLDGVIMGHGDTEVSLGHSGNLAVFLRNIRVIYGGMWQEMYCEGLACQ